MRLFRSFALGVALVSMSALAFGQHRDRDDRQIYRQGYAQGSADAQYHRRFHPDADRYRENDDRRAYREGYEAGYNSRGRGGDNWNRGRDNDNDNDRDDRWRNRGGSYGNGGNYGGYGNSRQIAQQNGYRDGVNDGRSDRATGHSFRPTHDDNYKNAPGYSSSMGDRQRYKSVYRQAYQQGYPLGYNGRR